MKFPAVSRGSALASVGLSMDVLWACSSVTLLPGLRPSLVAELGFAGDVCERPMARKPSHLSLPKGGVCGGDSVGGVGMKPTYFPGSHDSAFCIALGRDLGSPTSL